MLKRLLLTSFVFAATAVSSVYAQVCDSLTRGPSGRVVAISDGDTFDLDSGLTVRLVGIQAPKLPLGREGFVAWPLGDAAKAALQDLVLGEEVTLYYGSTRMDRHGRALGHVVLGDGADAVWVQQAMLEAGLARVYTFPDNRLCIAELYAAERRGRAERAGIWTDPYYQIRDAADPAAILDRIEGYELVEGRVLNADRVGGRVYLNFGRVWREDFTAVIEADALRLFEREGFDPLALENRFIRVRGWIESGDGPRMDLTHPEQIEIVGGEHAR